MHIRSLIYFSGVHEVNANQKKTVLHTHAHMHVFFVRWNSKYSSLFHWVTFCLNIFAGHSYFLFLPFERDSVRDRCKSKFVNLHQMPGVGFCDISKCLWASCTRRLSRREWEGIVWENQILSRQLPSYSFLKLISLRTSRWLSFPTSSPLMPFPNFAWSCYAGCQTPPGAKGRIQRLVLRKWMTSKGNKPFSKSGGFSSFFFSTKVKEFKLSRNQVIPSSRWSTDHYGL